MGIYIDKGNAAFRQCRNGEYVDKSGLIAVVNKTLFTEQRFACVSRCRRFGKSMAAKMLAAYYDRSCNSRSLFADLDIAQEPSFEEHLNKYPVIYLDLSSFVSRYEAGCAVREMDLQLKSDVQKAYPEVLAEPGDDLMALLQRIHVATGDTFFFIIDEWDAILRETATEPGIAVKGTMPADTYLNWLRRMFKDVAGVEVFAGVYMTGILPIKKYKTESAMNNFTEYSMVKPGGMARYFGFTKDEVRVLAGKYEMDFDDLEKWYDGYQIGPQSSMFNPNSVIQAANEQWCESYWGRTGAYASVADYISMNYEGLKDDILRMLAGERCPIDPAGFTNDLTQLNSRDDVLTVLIHLGYLSYDRSTKECYVPNLEVSDELKNAIRETGWRAVAKALEQSRQLLDATLRGDSYDREAKTHDCLIERLE